MAFDLIAFDIFFVFSILALVLALKRMSTARARIGLSLPPGPRGLPIVGNLFDIPTSNEWVVYRDWSNMYSTFLEALPSPASHLLSKGSDSSLVCVSTYGLHTVIVNSARAAHELFERRSALYSDRCASLFRPRMIMSIESLSCRPAMTALRLSVFDPTFVLTKRI